MLVLIATAAAGLAWITEVKRRQLADDHGQFYTHEEAAQHQAFMERAFLQFAAEAEQKAALANGPEAQQWVEEAREARRRAADCAKAKQEYQYRASLKKLYANNRRDGGA
jgi:hypothetical protein